MKGTFGYSLSDVKTMWEVASSFVTLGLRCDTVLQAWLVPEAKREVYREIARELIRELEIGAPDLWTLSRFAGKTAYCRRACGNIRRHQNLAYAVLTGRELYGEVPEMNRRWWEVHRSSQRELTSELRKMLAAEIARCVELVAADQVHPFVREEHVTLEVVERGGMRLFTDTTLDRCGFVIEEALRREGDERIVSGGVMPEKVAGVALGGKQTHTVEMAGLELSLEIIDGHPDLLVRFTSVRIDLHMDNFEDCRILLTGVVRGEYSVDKLKLAMRVWGFIEKWNSILVVHYVRSADNPADAPSRRKHEGEVRLRPAMFNLLWAVCGPFDLDGMASQANRMETPTGRPLPCLSKGLDAGSRGTNFFSGQHGRDPATGERERVWVNPPFVMIRAAVRWLKDCRAGGVLVTRTGPNPKPAWQIDLELHSDRVWVIPSPNSEGRRPGSLEGGAWEPLRQESELTACAFDYEKSPRSEAAEPALLPGL